mgnify:FL=1
MAATAVTLRWGSYLAVLLDHDKPVWPDCAPNTSRIDDAEMARINIEASAALAEWIDIYHTDMDLYGRLINRAVAYLPMPKGTSRPSEASTFSAFKALALPSKASCVVGWADTTRRKEVEGIVAKHASRVFANALLNTAWRNGPVEDIHAGAFRGSPLDQRRMTPSEETRLLLSAGRGLSAGMFVCWYFTNEQPLRPWPEHVLHYGLAELLCITPTQWSLTESSREMLLAAT